MAALSTQSIVCPVLIGRGSYLDALVQCIEQLYSGHGQTVLIAGEAGIGKSRLVAEVLAGSRSSRSQNTSPLVLQGRCFEPDRSLPYAPLLDLLRSHLASHSPDDIAALLGPTAPELARLLPEFATFLPQLAPGSNLDSEQEKRRLFQSLLDFFTRLSATQPLILSIEDIHWSDDNSLEFLLYLARRAHRILLLLTYRSEEEHGAVRSLLASLDRERLAVELTLTPLTIDEAREMIRTILGLSRAMDADFLQAIYRLTEGNPFFIEEILKSLVTSGELVQIDGRWERKSRQGASLQGISLPDRLYLPRSVQLAVQQRLDLLSAETRALLSLAAAAGQRFDFTLLQQLTRRNEADLVSLVKELIAAQLVVEEGEDLFAFRHALTRQAVYTDLLARERRALHRSIAEVLERMHAEALEARLGELAYHFYAAREWAKVLEYAQRAGEQAEKLYAPLVAIEQYTHSLEAARQLQQTPPLSLYRVRGRCYELLGDFEAARDDYTRALETAQAAHDSSGEWQSLFDLGYLWTGRDYEQTGNYLRRALELASAMNDPLILARTLNRVGNWYVNIEKPQEGLRYHLEARGIFEELADQRGLAEANDLLAIASYNIGGPITGITYYEQAITLWRALDERQGLASSLAMMGVRGTNYLNLAGIWATASRAECVRDGEEALAIARQLGWRSAEALALIFLGIGLGPRGEYGRALACAQAGLDIATEIEHEPWMGFAHLLLGILAFDLLALPTARQHLEQALELAKEMSYLFLLRVASGLLAWVCVAQQDIIRAQAVLKPEFSFNAPPQTAAQRVVWYAQAELELAQGHPDAALGITEQINASAGSSKYDGVILYVWYLRARAFVILKRMAEAETALLEAQTAARTHGARPMLWRLYIALGRLYKISGHRTQAAEQFAQARKIIEELAAELADETLRETFLRSAIAQMPRLPQPSPRRTAMQAFGGLTEREREVARLVAQGKSNRVIADELVVGERTVGTHVENILSKLGFSSRAQIAAWAVEKGLATR
jgi:DNA-binding CsgD family transcriptional regulator/tetratricopeptide (TPR) repeat protein